MNIVFAGKTKFLVVFLLAAAFPCLAVADEQYDQLKRQVEALQQQLAQVQETLKKYEAENSTRQEVADLRKEITEAAAWKNPNTLIHMSGYADVGYTDASNKDGNFDVGSFSPIFHYQYRDLVMLESEMEMAVTDQGETELALEYLTIDLFLGDYVSVAAGKFLSPVGQFRQNTHPSWINKLASAPPGFGHDGAAPVSEVGLQARGGFPMGNMFANYAAYVSNGPELNAVFEDGEFELEGIRAEGFGKDADGEKVFGGRIGFLPIPGLEVGISAATGKATVTAIELEHGAVEAAGPNEESEDEPGIEGPEPYGDLGSEPARNYDVLGFDFAWGLNNFRLRGEYVKTKIGAAETGVTASPGAAWKSWYTQASYLLPQTKWEAVLRYTDFDSPHASQDLKQWALGVNYLFSSSVIGKVTYEFNDGLDASQADDNRWIFQLAYGF